ncbi:uncharacterized protein N7496_000490 [Penicillium cataractarum]|uniref:BTB domain-containing protein n=1 Tax=Penicillium cataractarum TaxID=2100454 RepID=A0A9X0B647_9EURO|nr:uncharacterized protein N7496_000490 [Penicillium cataractarum]KAJ5389422.1 hypothetical protein N7496_000490 [Penicillium cataractarum]
MSKRKLEEDSPGFDNFPPLLSVTPSPDPKYVNDAVNQIAKLAFLSARYSDMKLICGDEVLHAHKLIVCPQSKYFYRACSSGFKEATEPFQFPDKEPALMKKVLEYLYTGTYTVYFKQSNAHHKVYASSLGSSVMGQSNAVEMRRHLFEPFPISTQWAAATSVNVDAGQGPNDGGSDNDFTASCLRNAAYFHARMFAEADYFLIGDLRQKAKNLFSNLFAFNMRKEIIQEAVEELYSHRGNYQELKEIAIGKLVKLLRDPNIKNDSLLSLDFMKSVPEFEHDLCAALIQLADQPLDVLETLRRSRGF